MYICRLKKSKRDELFVLNMKKQKGEGGRGEGNPFFYPSFQLFYLFFIRLYQLTIVAGGFDGGRKTEPKICFLSFAKVWIGKKN